MNLVRALFAIPCLLLAPISAQAEKIIIPEAITAQESAGLIYSDLQGAFAKSLWRGQPRSEITYLLKRLPATSPNTGIQRLKKRLLLSVTDTTLIDNDISIQNGDDLLTLRLKKMLEMGLFDDAYKLYTEYVPDPKDNAELARVGLLLVLNEKGLATACLENKVFSERFTNISLEKPFWAQINKICNHLLYSEDGALIEFDNSHILQAVYNDNKFLIPATAVKQLNKFSLLEQLVLMKENRIDYVALVNDPQPIQELSPQLTGLFLKDQNTPDSIRPLLKETAENYAIIDSFDLSEDDAALQARITTLPQEDVEKLLFKKLALAHVIEQNFIDRLYELRDENIDNIVYIQSLININAAITDYLPAPDDYEAALEGFSPKTKNMLNKLKISLDKSGKLSNNRPRVYEKQLSLTSEGDYGIHDDDWDQWLDSVEQNRFIGLTILVVLSKPNNSEETQDKALEVLDRLQTVGLIEQTQLIARNILGDLLSYNKEN